jgi:mono/diheme cytochrome c family protein
MNPEPGKTTTRGAETEPGVGTGEMPVFFMAVLAALIFLALLHLDRFGGGFHNQVYPPFESHDKLLAAQPMDPVGKRRAHGAQVYDVACKLCHQPNGLGTPGQFPPLDGSEWVNGPINRLVRIPHNGLIGPITVNGQPWNAAMPAMGAALTDEDMADLLTFIRSSWGNKSGPVSLEQVKKIRAEISSRTEPWTAEELLALPPDGGFRPAKKAKRDLPSHPPFRTLRDVILGARLAQW